MDNNINKYNVLVSCPQELNKYVEYVRTVIEKWNDLYSEITGVQLNVLHWSTDSYSCIGNRPQEILNRQLVSNSMMGIGIMWKSFGTPTENYGSGTEEEINLLLRQNKQVFMYFCEKDPKSISPEVNEFKNWCKKNSLYKTFQDENDFIYLLFKELKNWGNKYFKESARRNNESLINASKFKSDNLEKYIEMNKHIINLRDEIVSSIFKHDHDYSEEIQEEHEKRYIKLNMIYEQARNFYEVHKFIFDDKAKGKYEEILTLCAKEIIALINKNKCVLVNDRKTTEIDLQRVNKINRTYNQLSSILS